MFDLIGFCKDYNIPVTENDKSVSAGWYGLPCPFCHDQGSYHLGFNQDTEHFSCWKCGSHSTPHVIKQFLHCEWPRAYHVAEDYGSDNKRTGAKRMDKQRSFKYAEQVELPTDELSFVERDYLRDRGFDPEGLTLLYDLRSGGVAHPRWKYRIVIPIRDYDGRIVSATGRTYSPKVEPRYQTLPKEQSVIDPAEMLFGINLVYRNQKRTVVVEGPMDQMRVGPGSVATFGASVDPGQAAALVHYFEGVTICFDGNEAGRRGADKLAFSLSVAGMEDVKVVDLDDDQEPDTLSDAELEWLRRDMEVEVKR